MKIDREGIQEKAWSILQKLPTYPQWLLLLNGPSNACEAIKKLGIVDVHQLLYSIEILNGFFLEDNLRWMQTFLTEGWVAFLIDVLLLKYFDISKSKDNSIALSHGRNVLGFASKLLSVIISSYNGICLLYTSPSPRDS